jgi:hypothetical protein
VSKFLKYSIFFRRENLKDLYVGQYLTKFAKNINALIFEKTWVFREFCQDLLDNHNRMVKLKKEKKLKDK